jgi:hypothetical protein
MWLRGISAPRWQRRWSWKGWSEGACAAASPVTGPVMSGHKAMTKLKYKPRGKVRPDSVFHLCQEIDGEWYAIITARSDDKDADPIIAIAGPFGDREEASAHNGKCMELSRRNRQFYLVDMKSVPAKVRQRITGDVRRGWRQGDFERLRSWRGGDDLALNLAPKH